MLARREFQLAMQMQGQAQQMALQQGQPGQGLQGPALMTQYSQQLQVGACGVSLACCQGVPCPSMSPRCITAVAAAGVGVKSPVHLKARHTCGAADILWVLPSRHHAVLGNLCS